MSRIQAAAAITTILLGACGPVQRFTGDADEADGAPDASTDMVTEAPGDAPVDGPGEPSLDPAGDDGTVPDVPADSTTEAVCGNGVPEAGEECDDGNDDNTDACLSTCHDAECGDGYVWAGHEDCEGGMTQSCTTTCDSTGTQGCSGCSWGDCVPPAETCDGEDNDCDTVPDETFDCVLGSAPASCTTACTTPGTRECGTSCTYGDCCAATETCGNGCDDDCSGVADDGCTGPPANDTCSSPTSVSSGGRFTGNTDLATNNTSGSTGCSGYGPDVYFTFTLTSASDVFISTHGTTWDTVIYIGTTCGGTGVACEDDSDTFGSGIFQEDIQIDNLAAGTYYLTLDGFYSYSHGDYQLDIYFSPTTAPGNRCGDPLPLNTNPVLGATCSLTNVFSSACGGSAQDAVYYLLVTGTSARSVTLDTCNTYTDFDTVLSIRTICDSSSTEMTCNDDYPGCTTTNPDSSGIYRSLSPGLYYVIVDGAGTSCGNFQLDSAGL